MKFAKLFELENGAQVLIVRIEENDEEKLSIRSDFDGIEVSITLGYKTAIDADKVLDSWTLDTAIQMRNKLKQMLDGH